MVEACEIAKAARAAGLNAPVRTLWSREDDMQGGYYRPMHLHRARIGFDERGKVLAWDHVIVGQSITTGTVFEQFQVKNGIDATATEGMRDPYPLPMRLTVHHPKVNVPVLWWRSVGSTHTAFVMETLIDEIARTTKQDPVAYRMRLFGDKHPRHRAALQLAVDKSGYGKKQLPAGRAWGVAVHESFDSRRGLRGGSLGAGRPAGAAPRDRRRALQPGGQPAQRGGAGAGRGGHGPVDVPARRGHHAEGRRGRAEQLRRLHRGRASPTCPQFEVHIVPSADAPTGMGEPGLPPLAPAFANAIARLTGKPLRQLPFNAGLTGQHGRSRHPGLAHCAGLAGRKPVLHSGEKRR